MPKLYGIHPALITILYNIDINLQSQQVLDLVGQQIEFAAYLQYGRKPVLQKMLGFDEVCILLPYFLAELINDSNPLWASIQSNVTFSQFLQRVRIILE
jgi:hypothetical protein